MLESILHGAAGVSTVDGTFSNVVTERVRLQDTGGVETEEAETAAVVDEPEVP